MATILVSSSTPTLLLNANKNRRKIEIQVQAADVDATNTGLVHIVFGAQPNTTIGSGAQGEPLTQAAYIREPSTNSPLDEKFKQAVWALATVNNMSVIVNEEIESKNEGTT